jgi:uncharacterized protein YcfL
MKTLTLIVVLSLMLVGCKADSSKENAKAEKEQIGCSMTDFENKGL